MDGTLTLEKIDTTRDEALTLCDNMILHLKSGISDDNINILVGITNQISHILDKLIGHIDMVRSTEKKALKKDTITEKEELQKDINDDGVLKSKGRFTVIGSAPPYTYYNHPL